MLKLRIGLFLHQHKLFIQSTASIIKTQNLSSSCPKASCSSLPASHFLRSRSPVLIPSRKFWETFPSSVRSFHVKDELDRENYELVYRNNIFNYAFYGQLVSELTIMAQLGYVLYRGLNYFLIGKIVPATTQIGVFIVNYDLISLAAVTFFTIQNAIVFMAAQKALLRVYHKKDTDEYVFVTLTVNPFKSRKVICKPGALKSRNVENMWGFVFGNFQVDDRRYFLNQGHFKANYHYNRLMYEDFY